MSTMRDNYEQEVVSLKELLREKQRLLENIQGDKQ